jgi:hypothetical protein
MRHEAATGYVSGPLGLCVTCAALLPVGTACARKTPKDVKPVPITLDHAVSIARRQAEELGYDLDQMGARYDEANTAWNEHVRRRSGFYDSLPDLKSKLEARNYWAVHFGPKPGPDEGRLGGDVWVFVAKDNGDVLAYLRGK